MADGTPVSSGGPKFRIVAGRGLGERPSPVPSAHSPMPPENKPPHSQMQQSSTVSQHMQPQLPLMQHQIHVQVQGTSTGSNGIVATSQSATPTHPGHPPGSSGAGSDDQNMVIKCVRFFKTLIQLSQQPDQQQSPQSGRQTAHRVKELVSTVIFGQMPAEEFTARLQDALKSQAQPHLLPFLQKTLPYLRTALKNGEVFIEGISPPPGFPIAQNAQVQQPQTGVPQAGPHQLLFPGPVIPNTSQSMSSVSGPGITIPPSVETMDDPGPCPPIHAEEDVIQVRQLQEGALESALLRPPDIMKKITRRMNEACYVEEDVLTLISDAAEYRLRELLGELAVLAEHRVDPLRLNPNYGPIDDTRRQLRYIEEMDRQQEEQRENREKEALIRMSKSKGIAKDTIERAKEMQRADAEAKRNRDANAAAIAALSGNKSVRPKWDQVGGGATNTVHRSRIIRVNIRDLHALVSQDPRCSRSHLVHKLALSGPPTESI
uniref:TAFH domain-containing protein n=1 Tax=Heterorhabditis bacteriophora TaxID=37862 RepID=A0A1I7XPK0_HETBA